VRGEAGQELTFLALGLLLKTEPMRTDMGGENAELSVEQGVDSIIWLATEAPKSITGKFIRDRKQIEW